MMKFQESQPIFMQIVDHVVDEILLGTLAVDAQIPSVRELAVRLGVNPNTVMRAFERLTMKGLVYNKRGLGYFVSEGARETAMELRRQRFFNDYLPRLADEMRLLGITIEELSPHIG